MIRICLEYVHHKAEKIYVYASHEEGFISTDFFYKINGKIVQRHQLHKAMQNGESIYDSSIGRQKAVLRILNEDIERIIKLCKEMQRDIMTEMKLVYDVSANQLEAEYKYDLVYSSDPVKDADDIAEEWFEAVHFIEK
ncbi:DUF600 domain-containing protein [Paenibacillus kandeliae]|uniref:DUF600 domain-containing protein n=1 Tax=Paenibacillus kandeliae TaxID=3231269 RepID=UPI00345A1DFF